MESSNQEFYPLNDPNDIVVLGTNYNVSWQFADRLYTSCKNVMYPMIGKPAVTGMMCGPHGESCNGTKWLSFMGSMETTQTPFPINYFFTNDTKPPW